MITGAELSSRFGLGVHWPGDLGPERRGDLLPPLALVVFKYYIIIYRSIDLSIDLSISHTVSSLFMWKLHLD